MPPHVRVTLGALVRAILNGEDITTVKTKKGWQQDGQGDGRRVGGETGTSSARDFGHN